MDRLPASLDVSALIRAAQAEGGFAAVLRRGDADAGTILLVTVDNQGLGTLYERMPQRDGSRKWTRVTSQEIDNKVKFEDYLDRRAVQDSDVWIVELTIADGERFVGNRLNG